MESFEIFVADNLIERSYSLFKRLWCSQVVASCKSVASINTDAHTLLVLDQGDNVPQILPRRSDHVPAASHVLENRHHRASLLVRLVELRRYAPYSIAF